LKNNYDATREAIEQRVTTVKKVTYGAMEQVQQKYVNPMDEYLKDSLIVRPYNIALDVTEKMVDKILPEEKEAERDQQQKLILGPISKTTYLSKRIQQQAFSKLHHLSLRTPEKLNAMEYTVDLIKYAAQALDGGVTSLNQTFSKGVEAGTIMIKEVPKEVKEKIQNATHDALAALHTAIEVISNQIPVEISSKFNQIKEATIAKGDESLSFFSQVAQTSSNLLHDVGANIGDYISRGEVIPIQILSSAYGTLHKVLDNLVSIVESRNVWSSSNPVEPEKKIK